MDRSAIKRNPLRQTYTPFALQVGVTPTPLNTSWQQANLSGLYDSFILSLPKLGPNAGTYVLMGDSSVSIALNNGLEVLAGVPVQFSIDNERQLYELQGPLVDAACSVPESIPFVTWDPSTIYFIAPAPAVMGVLLFPAPFI